MKRARQYLSGFRQSVARLLRPSIPERPNFHQTALLAQFGAAVNGAEGAATAYFSQSLSAAGFLNVEEVPQLVTDYSQHKAAWCHALIEEAERRCRIGLPVYARTTGPLEGALDWSEIVTGAPKDRLYQLRPHRFGFLPRLAIAASCGANTLPAILAILDGWIAQVDKRRLGDAYFSNLVIVYRLLAIGWTAPFCAAMAQKGDKVASAICLRLFRILAADIHYLGPRLGDSVANNHLLSDRFAAWFMATCYPEHCPQADSQALERDWQEELCRQFLADGTNFEQSVHYHELGCEMAVSYLVISLRSGRRIGEPFLTQIGKMLYFQAALADHRGNSFVLGDATEDPLLPLAAETGFGGGTWRMLYSSLFDSSFPAADEGSRGAERAYWLLAGLPNVQKPISLPVKPAHVNSPEVFPDGGYVVFRDALQDQCILFRTGPRPGVEVYPGHAMSDLLSVYWNSAGKPVLEPSGTYSYGTEPAQGEGPRFPRDYFRSPAASNGIVLQGHDPLGEAKGRFRGRDNGTRVQTRWRFLDNVLSWAEGRLDESGPLNGYRRGVLHLIGRYTLVYDRLPPLPKEAEVTCRWQLAPEARVTIMEASRASVSLDSLSAFVCAGGDLADVGCLYGVADPAAGWVSRSYGDVQAAPQLVGTVKAPARDLAFVFGVRAESDGLPLLEVRHIKQNGMLLDIRRGGHRDIACIGDVCFGKDSIPFDLDFRGDALWVNIEKDEFCEIRALGLHSLRSSVLGLDLGPGEAAHTGGNWRLLEFQAETAGISGRWEFGRDA